MATEAQACALSAIKNRLPREIAKRYLTGAGLLGLNRLYTKYHRLTTNWPSTFVVSALQISPLLCKTNPISRKVK